MRNYKEINLGSLETSRHHKKTGKPLNQGFRLWWERQDSNLRPLECESSALPLSYAPQKQASIKSKIIESQQLDIQYS